MSDGTVSWMSRDAIRRVVCSLIASELRQSRGIDAVPTGVESGWSDSASLSVEDLEADSIERINCAAAVSEFFNVNEVGVEDYFLARATIGEWSEIVEYALIHGSGNITVKTSGSTGEPKACTHRREALIQEVRHWADSYSDRRRIVAAAPPHHLYGFIWTVLLPAALNIDIVDARDLRFGGHGGFQSGDLIVTHPTPWQYIARTCPSFPADVIGVSSTGVLNPATAHQLLAKGLSRLDEIYGASETGAVAMRSLTPQSSLDHRFTGAYRLLPYYRLDRLGDGDVLRLGADGRPDSASSILLQDHTDWRSATEFTLGARLDEAIQIGGINVYPRSVKERLLSHPGVRDCLIDYVGHGEDRRLKAIIVPATPPGPYHADGLRMSLNQWCRDVFTPPERPREFVFAEALSGQQTDTAVTDRLR